MSEVRDSAHAGSLPTGRESTVSGSLDDLSLGSARLGAAPERVARINVDAFRHNVRLLNQLAAPAETMLAVKADAYGHGMVPLAFAALEAGATSLAVLDIPAALVLRAAGITAPIFAWMHAPDADFGAAAAADIDLGLSAVWQLEAIAAAAQANAPRVHLKIDTGLHRNGASVEQWPGLVQAAMAADAAGVVRLHAAWSHLADASPADDEEAYAHFRQAVDVAEGLGARFEALHLAASSAGIRMPGARLSFVRFGIAAYGISPFDDETALELGLRPVMTLAAPVASLKRVGAGHGVSYGFDYRTTRPTTLALVPLGYADGVPRAANGRGQVWLKGRRYPIAGRIAMDQFVIDVGDDVVAVGDEVIVFGEGRTAVEQEPGTGVPTAEDWAGFAHTIGDEIVARVGPRVPRVYLTDDADAGEDAAEASATDGSAADPDRWVIADPEAMHDFGFGFASRLGAGDVLVLTGELGAGKTTFTRGLGEGLGVRGSVTSPTFVLARTHPNLTTGVPLVHVDAYRLGNAAELDDLDIDFGGSIVVVEWGSGLIDRIVGDYLELVIERPMGRAGSTDGGGADADETGEAPVEPRVVTLHRRRRADG
ncbi:alanine racemase [Subtercola sp. PAMC28395]|uniref:alanine racemase n=1 Tax=Subtercola sp. PAMC28395 TaxID=2846775 RepID=UPI00209A99FE|nr:alanine racemase [Subtercola sp. PAMC28395]